MDRDRWEIISPLLDEALEMNTSERVVWLASLRGRDASLAADVETLLADHSVLARESFLEGGGPSPIPSASLAGQQMGAWTLVAPIGRGGMGSVWLAERNDGRYEGRAAVKLLNAELVGRAGGDRFKREGSILGRLTHPHIAHLIDAGVAPGGQPYLVLEHVEGEPIDRYCDSRNLTVEARLRLFLDVLDAVAHAHANLIVHRDIKPSNVMVSTEGKVKLLDFGIAKLLEGDAATGEATALTREGGRALTPEFAAPEQVTGGAITTATDVHALGTLLYLLLAGRHPAGSSVSSPAALMTAILDTEPQRLSAAVSDARTQSPQTLVESAARRASTPDRLRRLLRGDLETIVAKALKKRPEERYASVTALAADLRRYLDGQPISARPDTWAYRTGKFVRRHRVGVAAAAGIAVVLAAGVWSTVRQWREAVRQRDLASARLERAQAASDFVELMISNTWGNDESIGRDEFLARSEALALRQLEGRPEQRSVVLHSLGSYQASLGNHKQAEQLLRQAVELLPATTDLSWRALVECNHASVLAQLGDAASTSSAGAASTGSAGADAGKATLQKWAEHPGIDPEAAVQCELYLAQLAQTTDDVPAALEYALSADEKLKRAPHPSEALQASVHEELGHGYALNNEIDKADRHFEAAVGIMRRLGQGESPAMVAILNNWAIVSWQAGDIKRALQSIDEVIALAGRRGAGGAPPPFLAANRAAALESLGRHAEAIAAADLAYAIVKDTANPAHLVRPILTKADAATEMRDFAQAERLLHEAELLIQKLPEGGFDPNRLPLARARIELLRFRPGPARDLVQPVIEALGDPSQGGPPLASALRLRAAASFELGERESALKDAETALAIGQRLQGGRPHALRTGQAWLLMARIKDGAGDREGARAAARSALEHLTEMLADSHDDVRLARQLASD